MNIAEFLTKAGLARYAGLFELNDIDMETAAVLSDEDLKQIGVSSLGHRRKLMELFSGKPASDAVVERRNVVIIFVDMVESTKLISSTDPEDAYALFQGFLNVVDRAVEAHGGTVERHLGDAVMAVFGAPIARGDEAIRAVNFAVGIHDLVSEMGERHGTEMHCRVGIAYGDVISHSVPGEQISVVGPSVNLAARLSSVAQPGQTLLSPHVTAACGQHIVIGPSCTQRLKGFDKPLDSFPLLGLSNNTSVGFVGRQSEIEQFESVISTAKATGQGQLIILRGEAGIGKTSLLTQWLVQAEKAGMRSQVAPIQNFGVAQSREARRTFIADLLALTSLPRAHRMWLTEDASQSLSSSESAMIKATCPDVRLGKRARAFEALVEGAVSVSPLLLAFEDAHWADDSMLDLIAECSRLANHLPLIVVATTRIEGDQLDAQWRARIAPTQPKVLSIGALSSDECRDMATAVIGKELDASDAIARSSGHPLFLEQLLRHGQEDSFSDVPQSIHTLIQARIDLLDGADRYAARVAAILGQRVDLSAMRHILDNPNYDPISLVERRILRQTDGGLVFHHALIRDCVSESVLRGERIELHRAAAEWYQSRSTALYADHLSHISHPDTAAAYLAATEEAMTSFEYEDAAQLSLAGQPHAQSDDLLCRLQIAEADAYFKLNRQSEAIEAYRRAAALVSEPFLRLKAMIGEITTLRLIDHVDEARARIVRAERIARDCCDDRALSHLKYLSGALLFPTGDFQGSLAAHEEALALATRVNDPERIADALSGRGDALYAQGRMGSAGEVFGQCLALCEEHGLTRVKAQNLFMRGTVRVYALDWAGALDDALVSADLAKSIGNARAEIVSRLTASWVYAWTGNLGAAKTQARLGLELSDCTGAIRFKPFLSEAFGHALFLSGDRSEAITCLTKAAEDMREAEAERFIGPWVLGSLALAVGPGRQQSDLLAEGEHLLEAGAIGHNHFQFRRLAIDAAIAAGDQNAARIQAEKLAAFTRFDPTRWSDHEIARALDFADQCNTMCG